MAALLFVRFEMTYLTPQGTWRPQFALMSHPLTVGSAEEKRQSAEELFSSVSKHLCCCEPFARSVCRIAGGPAGLLEPDMQAALRQAANSYGASSNRTEARHARNRARALRSGQATSLVWQGAAYITGECKRIWLARSKGGRRALLKRFGPPAHAKRSKRPRRVQAWMQFVNHRLQEHLAVHGSLPFEELNRLRSGWKKEYESLSVEQKRLFTNAAVLAAARPHTLPARHPRFSEGHWQMGSLEDSKAPIRPEIVNGFLASVNPSGCGRFSDVADSLYKEVELFRSRNFEQTAATPTLPEDDSSCHERHYGFCARDHKHLVDSMLPVHEKVLALLQNHSQCESTADNSLGPVLVFTIGGAAQIRVLFAGSLGSVHLFADLEETSDAATLQLVRVPASHKPDTLRLAIRTSHTIVRVAVASAHADRGQVEVCALGVKLVTLDSLRCVPIVAAQRPPLSARTTTIMKALRVCSATGAAQVAGKRRAQRKAPGGDKRDKRLRRLCVIQDDDSAAADMSSTDTEGGDDGPPIATAKPTLRAEAGEHALPVAPARPGLGAEAGVEMVQPLLYRGMTKAAAEAAGYIFVEGRANPVARLTTWGKLGQENVGVRCMIHSCASTRCNLIYSVSRAPPFSRLRTWAERGPAHDCAASHLRDR